MNKQNKKSKNQVSTESLFKPIIATSLAVALGVSVSVGAPETINSHINSSAQFDAGDSLTKPVDFYINTGVPATGGQANNAIAGLLFSGGGALTLTDNLTIAPVNSSIGNAYGIYANSTASKTISSQAFNTITIGSLTAGPSGQAYVFKNAGTATLENVGIVYGAKSLANTNVAIADSLGGHYDFGTTGTTITLNSIDTTTGNVAGFDISGGKTTTLKGKLTATITAGNIVDNKGATISNGSATGFSISGATLDTNDLTTVDAGQGTIGVDSAQGGTAVGIKLSNNATLNGNLTFAALGANAETAQGLVLNGGTNTTNILNGNLTFAALGANSSTKVSGIEGSGTLKGKGAIVFGSALTSTSKNAHIINATGALTFEGVGINTAGTATIVGAKYGLLHNIDKKGANAIQYLSGNNIITFKVTGEDGVPTGTPTDGGTAVGLDLKSNLALAYAKADDANKQNNVQQQAKFVFDVKGGIGNGTTDGGNAVGLILNGKTITQTMTHNSAVLQGNEATAGTKDSLEFSVVGGAGTCEGGTCSGKGGDAIAIVVNDGGGADSLANNTINITKVEGGFANLGSDLGKAYVIAGDAIGAVAKKLTLDKDTRINVGTKSGNSLINHAQNVDTFALDLIGQKGGIYNLAISDGLAITPTKGNISLMNLTGAAHLNGEISGYQGGQAANGADGVAGSNGANTSATAGTTGGTIKILEISNGKLSAGATVASIKASAGGNGGAGAVNDLKGEAGGAGGNAIGISFEGSNKFTDSLTFNELEGGAGGNGGVKSGTGTHGSGGIGGSAIGITGSGEISSLGKRNSRDAEETKESYLGGTLTFKALKGGQGGLDGGSTNQAQGGSAYVIKVDTGKKITFEGISIIANKTGDNTDIDSDTTYGLYHENINGGATPQYKGDINFKNVVNIGNKNVIGLDLKEGIDLSEAELTFGDILNEGITPTNTKLDAIGMQMYANTGITKANIDSKKKELTFESVISTNGTAIGLNIRPSTESDKNVTADLTGYNLTFKKIEGKGSNAYAIKNANEGGTQNHSLKLDETTTLLFGQKVEPKAVISHNGTDGLYQFSTGTSVGTDVNKSTLITLGKDKDIALSFSGIGSSGIEGSLTIDATVAPTAINAPTSFTALKIDGGTPSSRASEVGVLTLVNGMTNLIGNSITLTAGGKADAIGIDASGTFALGGTLTFTDITSGTAGASDAIGLQASGNTTINGANGGIGQIVFSGFTAHSQSDCCTPPPSGATKGSIYAIKNEGTLTLNNVGVVVGNIATASTDLAETNNIYGIYHGLAQAQYSFGDGGTTISMINKGSTVNKNVIGLAVDANLNLSGKLTFAKLANESASGNANKSAYGVYIADGKKLTLGENVKLASDNISATGNVYGIYVGDTQAELDISKSKTVDFDFKGLDSTSGQAYGLFLETATSKITSGKGSELTVSASGKGNVAALGTASGISNSMTLSAYSLEKNATAIMTDGTQASTIASGSIIKVNTLKADMGTMYVIDNSKGTHTNALTIAGGDSTLKVTPVQHAQIIATKESVPADVDFAIYHGIKDAGYKGYIKVGGQDGSNTSTNGISTDKAMRGMIITANTFVEGYTDKVVATKATTTKGMEFAQIASNASDTKDKLALVGLSISGANLDLQNAGISFAGLKATKGTAVGLQTSGDVTISGDLEDSYAIASGKLNTDKDYKQPYLVFGNSAGSFVGNGLEDSIKVLDNSGKLTINKGARLAASAGGLTLDKNSAVFVSNLAPATSGVNQVVFNFGQGEAETFVDGGAVWLRDSNVASNNPKEDDLLEISELKILNVSGAKLTGNLRAKGTSIAGYRKGDSDYNAISGIKNGGDLVGFDVTNGEKLNAKDFRYTLIGGDGLYRADITSNGGNVYGFKMKDNATEQVLDIQNSSITLNLIGGNVRNIQNSSNENFKGGNAEAINIVTSQSILNIRNGQLVFETIKGGFGNENGKAYALNNAGTLNIEKTASLVFGEKTQAPTDVTFGIYHGIENLNYQFGTTNINVGDEKTANAVGLVLAKKANFEGGQAIFNVNGATAEGIRVGGNAEINFTDDGTGDNGLTFNVGTDETISKNAIGISGKEGTLTIRNKKDSKTGTLATGKLAFNVGNHIAEKATGLSLENTTFDGFINFSSITASSGAGMFGLTNAANSNSVIKKGSEIKFGAFRGVGATVLHNEGTLTIHKGAWITTRDADTNVEFAAISNNLEDVKYNLGNLNIVLADASPTRAVTGIASDKLSANFIVGAGKKLRIEGDNYGKYESFKRQRAFGGTYEGNINPQSETNNLNLILEDGARVELGVDGGKIAKLQAGSTSTINLAGDISRTQDTNGIFYRSLTVNELVATSATTGTPATFANQADQAPFVKGANFTVLASRTGVDGALKSQLNPADPKVIDDVATGYAYNADGSLYTTTKEITGYQTNGQGNLIFDEFGNTIPVYREVYSLNQGGSDRIIIDNTTGDAVGKVNATLEVGVRGIEGNEKDNTPKYVVLAAVKNRWVGGEQLKDRVIFNGLEKDGKTTLVEGKEGFDVVTIEIGRKDIQRDGIDPKEVRMTEKSVNNGKVTYTDKVVTVKENWSDYGAVYYSDLRAKDRKINDTLADASLSLINTNYMLMSANLNSLNKRLGELRNTDNSQGLWGRLFAGQQSADFGMKQTTTYLTFQVGYDYNFKVGNGTNYVGAAISYISGSSTQDQANFSLDSLSKYDNLANASAKSNGFEAALYNTYVAENGFYSDSIFKVGYSMSNLNVPEQTTYDVDNYSIALSEELGYKVTLGSSNEWNITPQVELAYAFINAADFTQSFSRNNYWMSVSQDAAQMLRTRVGVNWAYSFDHLADEEKGIKANLYVGTYYAYDANFGGKTNLRTNGGSVKSYDALKSDGRFVLNVGTDVSIQDATKFYVDFEKSFGGTLQTDYQFSVGVRYGFGAKNSEVKKDGDDKKAAPLKIKDEEQE